MVLTKALVLKSVIGATTIAVPASLMVAYRKEISSYFSPSNLTEFDQGLIDYLDSGGDIQFKVIKGESGNTDLTADDLSFSGNTPITISAKIKVTTETSDNIGTLTDASGESVDKKAQKSTLQKLNGSDNGTAWTWICEIQLSKETGNNSTNSIKNDIKSRMLGNSNGGLFGILKSELGSDDKKDSKKKVKQDFIRNCAESRTKNKTFGTNSNEIKTPKEDIIFEFQQKTGETDLIPKDEKKFNKWFPSAQPT